MAEPEETTGELPERPLRFAPIGGIARYLAALRQFDRNVRLFLVCTAFRGMVIATLQTVLNLYLYSLGYDARFIGLINGFNSLAVLLVSVPFGYLADRFGRRPVLVVGGIAYPIAILAVALARSTPLIILFIFLFGVFAAAYWVAGVPLLFASTRPRERAQAFSLNSFLLWGLGPLGAFLAGQVVEIAAILLHVSANSADALRFGMYFMALLAAAGAIPYLFLHEPARPPLEHQQPVPRGAIAWLAARLLIPDVILAFGLGAVLTFSQLYFHLRFNLDPGAVGVVIGIGGVVAGAATLFTPILARRWGNLRATVRLQWSVAPLIGVMALSMVLPVSLVSFFLVVMFRGMADPVYTAFVQERVPERYRARLTGMYSVTYSIGYSLGPTVSGQLQKVGGFTPAFLMGAACYFTGALLLYLFFGRERQARYAGASTGSPAS